MYSNRLALIVSGTLNYKNFTLLTGKDQGAFTWVREAV